MTKEELIKRSPIRDFEKSLGKGLEKGEIGGIAAKKGVGKTASLVHLSIDNLLRGEHVIHVSFSERVDHIINWYENAFREIASSYNLPGADEIYDTIIKQRVIMNFRQENLRTQNVLASLESIIRDGGFPATCVVFDGFELNKASEEDIASFRTFAEKTQCEIWFSLTLRQSTSFDEQGVPNELKVYLDYFDILLSLRFEDDDVRIKALKMGRCQSFDTE